jgi:branched-chain amino acid transport system substrate-binding protein
MNKTAKTILYLIATIVYLVTPFTYAAQKTNCQPDTLVPVKYRQSGSEVRNLQACLIQAGYSIPAGATGYYGLQTVNAVKKFYADWYGAWSGLSIGPQGIAHLKQVVTKAPTTTTTKEPQPTTPTTKEPIKIGAILPLTGTESRQAELIRNGMTMAQEEINKNGGINGRRLEIIIEDNKGEAKEAVSNYNFLKNVHNVPVILTIGSPTALALSPLVNQDKILLFAIAATPAYKSADDYTFRINSDATKEGEQMAQLVYEKLGIKELAVVYMNNDYGVGTKNAFLRPYTNKGGKVLIEEAFNPGTSDFRTILLKIKQTKPKALYIASWGKEAGIIAKQAKEIGLDVQFLCGQACQNLDLIKEGGKAVENLIYPYAFLNTETKFYKDYLAKYGEPPTQIAERPYDIVRMFAAVVKECGDINRECLLKKFYETEFQGTSSKIKFDRFGDVIEELVLYTVKDGKFVLYK